MGLFDDKKIKQFINTLLSYNSSALGYIVFAPRSVSRFDKKSFEDTINRMGMRFCAEKTRIAAKAFERLNFSVYKTERLRGTRVCYVIDIPSDRHFSVLCKYLTQTNQASDIVEIFYRMQSLQREEVVEKIAYRRRVMKEIMASLPDGIRYYVMLTDFCDSKIKLIKVVRKITHNGLAETKELVERAPVVVYETDNMRSAAEVCFELEQAGGKVQIVVI